VRARARARTHDTQIVKQANITKNVALYIFYKYIFKINLI